MKVYIVTTGSYSDYGIDRVFTDKTKAEAYFADLTKVECGDCDIQEYETDQPQEQTIRQYWMTAIDLLTGQMKRVERKEGWYEWAAPGIRSEWEELGQPAGKIETDTSSLLGGRLQGPHIFRQANVKSYVSQEHSDKAAAELRQRALRELGGVQNLLPFSGLPFLLLVKRQPSPT